MKMLAGNAVKNGKKINTVPGLAKAKKYNGKFADAFGSSGPVCYTAPSFAALPVSVGFTHDFFETPVWPVFFRSRH
ncbi:MAG: hypothetical protein Q7T36_01665 [Fluviicoccus sp.]|uniref:hypothetical protein n=1 Tax=Fluviicoccus sp. TaxID=2003552 RepID=UPI002719BDCA|nr:hypothetical protein [Fluviicoccus sp.]MDO8329163.1 hypothetical protein [Fluviicoccus sp.]